MVGLNERFAKASSKTRWKATRRAYALPLARSAGITLIELLVSISIIALLISLILPAVNSARESARRIDCANRAKNISLAMLSFAATHDRFPAAGYWGGGPNPDKNNPLPHHNWVVDLLPYLDRVDLADRWNGEEALNSPHNQQIGDTHVSVLVCPSDITVNGGGDLSFAVNGGVGDTSFQNGVHDCVSDPFYVPLDLNGNGTSSAASEDLDGSPTDREIYFRLGVFFSENWKFAGTLGFQGVKRHHTPASIDDGMSNTLLIGENVRTGYDPVRPGVNWSTAWGSQTRFYFNHEVCADHSCTTGSLNFAKANGGGHAINAGRYAAEGESPFLNSFHSGLAVVGFADGRVQFLSESVDGRVYFNLCTPKGIRLKGTPLDAGVTTDGF